MVDCVKKAVIAKQFFFLNLYNWSWKFALTHIFIVSFQIHCEGVHKQNYKNDVIAITNIVFWMELC